MDTVTEIDQSHHTDARRLADEGVAYALASWTDVLGRAKSKVVPIAHLPEMLAGSERYTPRGIGGLGRMNPHEDECVAMPDPGTMRVLPWDRRFAWMAADLLSDGRRPWELCPRSILKEQLQVAEDMGFRFDVGIETELYVFDAASVAAGERPPRPLVPSGSLGPTPVYDLEASLDSMPFLHDLVGHMDELGFGVYSFDHEGGEGQFEFDFGHAPALETADRITLFRVMVRQVAKQHGGIATFMPKPITGGWGSGHHFNMSLVDRETGANAFRGEDGWSDTAYHFAAGVLRHARALSALGNPTVNSYKRLAPRLADGSITWAPIYAAYGDNNRSCMLRMPRNRPCLENRAIDSAANIHLTAAFTLAAGLEGVRERLDPGEPGEADVYLLAERDRSERRLPRTLLEAVDAFADDDLVRKVFSQDFVDEYVSMKYAEWDDYHSVVSDWEMERYLTDL